ncbi:carboxypeptidase M32 [Acetobacter sp. AN02]|uniref:carboxypeptidase M32 n=1 Tax=Acetobacter sp. AN02 TaxID=2894186 RepID=UPI0024345D8E|nr:carboxypeptidase M32 [Acetobacter sp. AN02]MDG6094506.1 carboxypeptidase M32 [Acetobacter sp. AN02]
MDAYRQLEQRFAQRAALSDAYGILSWDQNVMMPEGASERRAEVMAGLQGLQHRLLASPETGALLEKVRTDGSVWQDANLALMKRAYTCAMSVPTHLVEALTAACVRSEAAWRTARQNSDFKALQPHMQTVLDLTREMAQATGEALGLSPYDALLDQFDPGMRQETIAPLFAELAENLPPLLDQVLEHQASRRAAGTFPPPAGPFPVPAQEVLGREVMKRMGFDFTRGRLDVSLHPFCGGATGDVRITTRYREDDFLQAFFGIVHETGHALYEQGLPEAWHGQPAGGALGMTMHESQSLIMEMQFCRSEAFIRFAAPLMSRYLEKNDQDSWSPDALLSQVQHVRRGLIRVEADEVTYPAHVLVRYELETAMIAGDLALKDLPEAFNARFKELMGTDVPDDRRGCLQDIHWPDGLFGYFPCYTLGALTAAQFATAMEREIDVEDALSRGDFAPLREWLGRNVWSRASSAGTQEIIRDATGKPLGTEAFLTRIRNRYLGI